MRLGMNAPDEWKTLMPILNDTKLTHITVHPRTAKQMYGGEIYRDEFSELIKASNNPIIWNSDILTQSDLNDIINEFPQLKGVMIGRGLLGRPSLAMEWKNNIELKHEERVSKLLQFHGLLLDAYKDALCGDTQILQKIKPFWDYLEPEIGHKSAKLIKKASSLSRYESIINDII